MLMFAIISFMLAAPSTTFEVTPENIEHFILLLEQDRLVLKTLLMNAQLFYENCVWDMTLESYNASSQAGLCSVKQGQIKRKLIQDERKKLEAGVDVAIDAMIGQWKKQKIQNQLFTQYAMFWSNRDELYKYVTNKKGYCSQESSCSTGWGKMEVVYFESFYALSQCKKEFWPTKNVPVAVPQSGSNTLMKL